MLKLWNRVYLVSKASMNAALRFFGVYLDDLLLLSGGCCVVRGVYELAGRPWALLTAGAWLTGYAVVVARSRKEDG